MGCEILTMQRLVSPAKAGSRSKKNLLSAGSRPRLKPMSPCGLKIVGVQNQLSGACLANAVGAAGQECHQYERASDSERRKDLI